MTTIAEAVEIAEQTGLADRIRANDLITESELACRDFFQAVEGDRLYTAERERTAELEARLHLSEQTIVRLQARIAGLETLLESLTPGGSEFHNSPEACAEWARRRLNSVIREVQKRQGAEAELVKAREAGEELYEFICCMDDDLLEYIADYMGDELPTTKVFAYFKQRASEAAVTDEAGND